MTDEDKALQLVKDKFQESRDLIEPLHKKLVKIEKSYWGVKPTPKGSVKSNVNDPIAYEQVEYYRSHLFAGTPRGRVIGREPGDDLGAAEQQAIFKFQWENPKLNMKRRMNNMGQQAGMFGTAWGILDWKYVRGYKNGKHFTEINQPWFTPINIFDCYPDVSASNPEEMEYFIYDEFTTVNQLEKNNTKIENSDGKKMSKYKNLAKLKELAEKNSASDGDSYRDNAKQSRKTSSTDAKKGRIKLRHYLSADRFITVAEEYNIVIEDRDNPYGFLNVYPLYDTDYYSDINGIGEIEMVQSMIEANNQGINMRMDKWKQMLDVPMAIRSTALKYAHTHKFERGARMVFDDIDRDMKVFPMNDDSGAPFVQTTNFLKDAISRAQGRVDFITRNESNAQKTAKEISAAQGEQNARLKYKEANVDNFVQRLVTDWLTMNEMFLDEKSIIRITGKEIIDKIEKDPSIYENVNQLDEFGNPMIDDLGMPVYQPEPRRVKVNGSEYPKLSKVEGEDIAYYIYEPKETRVGYDFIVETGSTIDPDTQGQIQNMKLYLDTVAQFEGTLAQQGYKVNLVPILTEMGRSLGQKNVDQLFESVQNDPMMMQQGIM